MISKIIIKNFRKFRECEINLNPDVNILVGANESGKTTILDAINLALTGRINGRWARDELNHIGSINRLYMNTLQNIK